THVSDVMRTGDDVPWVGEDVTLLDALREMTRKRMGMTAVLDRGGRVVGIFTDGDLRRALERSVDLRSAALGDVMTRNPRTIQAGKLAVEAVEMMERHKVNQLLVVDESDALTGALNMHDLFRAKVI